MSQVNRRKFLSASAALSGGIMLSQAALGQESRDNLTEPVIHVAKKDAPAQAPASAPHPLDPALDIAYRSLNHIRSSIRDYTAIMVKRELVGGQLTDYEYIGVKVRNRQVVNGQIKVPFSVYMTFLAPASVKGREVIYVENQNSGNLVAHEGGLKGRFLPTVELDPNGMMAMRGQRYPITDMGVENLVVKLIEKGERDRKQGPCGVEFAEGAKVDKRDCKVLTVSHNERRPCFDFCEAKIWIDNEMNIPVRYCAYEWPKVAGGEKILLEEYTYTRIKTNLGLQDIDFDRANPKYRFK